jgi:DNA-binding CsgD family transcriptional regulator
VEVVDGAIRPTRPLAELGTPESVREVVSQRLSRLAPATTDLLELTAAAGSEFGLDIVREASGLTEPDLLTALEEAARSGMIEELPSRRLSYRFTHELVRRALYDRLSGVRRAELHLRVGEALERSEGRSGRALADLAHHFAAAAPLDGPQRGIEYNVAAARAAVAAVSFDEAATRLRTALELGIESPAKRAEVFLELGTASHRAGDAADALQAFAQTAGIARELGDGELLARAAIGYEEACWRPGIADQGAVELLEEATTALGDDNLELRAGLLGGLARGLVFQGEHERGAIVRTNAVALARRLDDPVPLATVLVRSYWSRGTSSLDEILAMLTEAVDLGEELGDTEILAEAMAWRVPTFVALGDLDAARLEIAAVLATAEQTAQPFMLHVAEHYGSSIALCDGRLEEAESRARHSHEWSRLLSGSDAAGVYGIQMFNIRREQGRLAELAPIIRILATDADRGGPWRPGLVSVLVELGMEAEARRELARVVDDGLDPFRESLWLAALVYLTDACSALGDEAAAAIVYPELEPLAGTNVMIGHLVACHGAADRYLGMLAATLGESERAEEHFERAMELNRRMGALTWLAHTAYEYGRLLVARGTGERDRADALLGEAVALAERIGMPALLARVRALGSAAPTRRHPDELSAREVEILSLVARGMSNREIGAALFISEHTAANHIRSILRKTRCANRTEAASYAHRHGLVGA